MRIIKTLSVSLIICQFLFACFALSCSKKEPDPPKPPQGKVELPPPKPPEPPKQYAQEVKEAPKLKETEKPIPEKHGKKILKKKIHTQKPKTPVVPPAHPQIVNLDRLNREFKTYHLNVWASEWSSKEILLNGYVKNEREREDALSLARRYNPNITDMIDIVTVYDTSIPAASRRHQPYPYSNSK
ncbi:MAG: hypothetical protein NTX75_13345 [Proteobacteria bacterium]|nr:hypothetical protein [Pseudomonadota bacterium]